MPDTENISVAIPCFNEEMVIPETHRRLVAVLENVPNLAFELIYIDDGSDDGTLEVLRTIQAGDSRVRVVSLSRNFGHQTAATVALEHAIGDAVVLIDADLQDPPELIPEMVRLWRDGADVVYGVRRQRSGETAFKRSSAALFYRLLNRLSDIPIPTDSGDFRLLDRRVVNILRAMPERDRYLRGMVAWVGFDQRPLFYDRAAREAGISKYPLRRMLALATDGLLSFSVAPLRLAVWVGLFSAVLSMLGICYALILRLLTNIWVPGWTLLFIALLFFGGVQLLFLGVIGEYLGRVYGEVKRRPLYVIDKRLGFDDRPLPPSQDRRL